MTNWPVKYYSKPVSCHTDRDLKKNQFFNWMKYCIEVASSIVGAGSSPTFSMLVVIKPDKVGLFVAVWSGWDHSYSLYLIWCWALHHILGHYNLTHWQHIQTYKVFCFSLLMEILNYFETLKEKEELWELGVSSSEKLYVGQLSSSNLMILQLSLIIFV